MSYVHYNNKKRREQKIDYVQRIIIIKFTKIQIKNNQE